MPDFTKLENDLNYSISEEQKAIVAYRTRAREARAMGSMTGMILQANEVAVMYDHIIGEEQHHIQEEQTMLWKVQAAKKEASRKTAFEEMGKQKLPQYRVGDRVSYKAQSAGLILKWAPSVCLGTIQSIVRDVYTIRPDHQAPGSPTLVYIYKTGIIGKA